MLEIPESHTLAAQLNETVGGKTITRVIAAAAPHGFAFYFGDPGNYPKLLEGEKIRNAAAYAGLTEISAGGKRILFGDGTNVRYLEPGAEPPKKHQLLVTFGDGSSIVCTIQMYGGIWAFPDGKNDSPYYKVAKEKPSPLSDAFDEGYFMTICGEAKPTLSAKALLATEQRIPGLGNGVLQDILFTAGINPKNKINTLTQKDLKGLYKSIRKTLKAMTDKGGRDTEKDLFGKNGGYKTILSNNTLKDPCPVCGGTIIRQAYLGGNVYYCPVCQPLKKQP
ncbi:hypothetical protein [Breznakiella homolactica]|uniref:DNA-(apurinic or apyrimidinic site) lyase n=1 Tax=Breznakiella homolactica TaxID=2798577 RepID=A0A7T7XRT1_9SPIR|nr:hypothetical protein [Breznakiella homolactica]QQO11311.1 hypothetical protein JFL75_04125 [Breznakiella homolactica]